MFEFITVSNGELAILHSEQGHVYRFRPANYGDWSHLRLSRREKGEGSTNEPEVYLRAAYAFAAQSVRKLGLTNESPDRAKGG